MAISMLASIFAGGGRTTRYGDFTVVIMSACAFVTTPMELQQAEMWARTRPTTGNVNRDRMGFLDRFQIMLARSGSGISSKGNRKLLATIVRSMKANALPMDEWSIPLNLDEDMDIKRKAKPLTDAATPPAEPEPVG
ncbi:MAG TPA: hypothetical protein VM074_02775 [Solimonas sp.]|nr:hypothetical protein [Solimonas sp.]